MPGGMAANEPAVISCVAASSNFGPDPRLSVPEITVTCSATGCVCGGTLNPGGNCRRMVNNPSLVRSPEITAILAPGGNPAGPSVHFKSAGVIMTCPALAVA